MANSLTESDDSEHFRPLRSCPHDFHEWEMNTKMCQFFLFFCSFYTIYSKPKKILKRSWPPSVCFVGSFCSIFFGEQGTGTVRVAGWFLTQTSRHWDPKMRPRSGTSEGEQSSLLQAGRRRKWQEGMGCHRVVAGIPYTITAWHFVRGKRGNQSSLTKGFGLVSHKSTSLQTEVGTTKISLWGSRYRKVPSLVYNPPILSTIYAS